MIKPSNSHWSSSVVLLRKRGGKLCFCVDYRIFNSVTKPYVFPLPRINDLLYQLGKSIIVNATVPWIFLQDTGKSEYMPTVKRKLHLPPTRACLNSKCRPLV